MDLLTPLPRAVRLPANRPSPRFGEGCGRPEGGARLNRCLGIAWRRWAVRERPLRSPVIIAVTIPGSKLLSPGLGERWERNEPHRADSGSTAELPSLARLERGGGEAISPRRPYPAAP